MDTIKTTISAEFPYSPHYQEVFGSQMHYIEQGSGDPIVFIHGVPTWSYLWRNVIPHVAPVGRAIAVDCIGFGKSDKPDITYSIKDHINYFTEMMQQLDLSKITLVMHGWGSIIGFSYAMQFPEKIKGLVFLESHIRPPTHWEMLSLPIQQLSSAIEKNVLDYSKIVNSNFFIEDIFPVGILRTLTKQEMDFYRQPFPTAESRRPIWQYLLEIPLGEEKNIVIDIIEAYSRKLENSALPKLMLYSMPGFLTTMETVSWAKANLANLTLADIGEGLHYPQESCPETIGQEIRKWYETL